MSVDCQDTHFQMIVRGTRSKLLDWVSLSSKGVASIWWIQLLGKQSTMYQTGVRGYFDLFWSFCDQLRSIQCCIEMLLILQESAFRTCDRIRKTLIMHLKLNPFQLKIKENKGIELLTAAFFIWIVPAVISTVATMEFRDAAIIATTWEPARRTNLRFYTHQK